MENNNNFENGFYGSAPQKPFTDKSSDAPANPQTFSASEGESVNQSEPTAAEMPIEQPVQNNPEVNNAQQETYQQNLDFAPQRPDYAYAQQNDYSHPQYSGRVNYPRNGMPVQNNYGAQGVNYGGYNPQPPYNPNPHNQYNPNFQNNQKISASRKDHKLRKEKQ